MTCSCRFFPHYNCIIIYCLFTVHYCISIFCTVNKQQPQWDLNIFTSGSFVCECSENIHSSSVFMTYSCRFFPHYNYCIDVVCLQFIIVIQFFNVTKQQPQWEVNIFTSVHIIWGDAQPR